MTEHPHDELQEVVSGRLAGPERVRVDAHLDGCAACRDLLDGLTRAREALRAIPAEPVPDEARHRVLAALDAEDRMGRPRVEEGRRRWSVFDLSALRLVPKAAFVMVFALVAVFAWRGTRPPALVRETAAELRKYQRGASPLGVVSEDPAEVNEFFARAGLPFTPKAPGTRGASCRLKGACLRESRGRTRSVVAYGDGEGHALLCSAFPGDVRTLARGARTFVAGGRTFYVHEVNGVTLVCWQQGEVTNLLASDMPRDALLAVAREEAGG